MTVDRYRVPPRDSLTAFFDVRFRHYPYRENLKLLRPREKETKIAGLVDLLIYHHPNSAIHSFEVGYLVALLDPSSDQVARALVHDIGKTGIDPVLLDKKELTKEERRKISFHGPLGGAILRRVGLNDLAYSAEEHHIGNSTSQIWTQEELMGRHPKIEVLSLADLICALLDPRRLYHASIAQEVLLENIRKKTETGVFSEQLYQRFLDVVVSKNIFPPFNLDDYQDEFFIEVLKSLGIYNTFQGLIADDENSR